MLRKLLATTALASVLATGAVAQDAAQPMQQPEAAVTTPETAAPAQPAATSEQPPADAAMQETAAAPAAGGEYIQTLGADQYLATELAGQSVYGSQAADAEAVGEIQNFLVEQDGRVAAAIIDATIGDESRTIAIPFDQLAWAMDENNEPRAVLTAGIEQLAQAPAFAEAPADQAAADPAMNAAAPAMTGVDPAAPASSDMAAAPADPAAPVDTAQTTEAQTTEAQTTETAAASGDGSYPATVGPNQVLSENLVGEDVYNGPSQEAEDIGEINDLIVASSGQIDGIVIGVGGFLGIGEKEVAVPFDQVNMAPGEDGELRASLSATKEQLEQAPGFEAEDQQVAQGSTAPMAEGTETAVATGAAAGGAAGMAAGTAVQETEELAADAGQATEDMAAGAGQEIEGVVEAPPADSTDVAQTTQPAADPAATGMATSPDATTTASTGGQAQGLTPVDDSAQLSADDLLGTTVYGPNDETIGDIGDIALNAEGGIDALIIDVGGFLGIGEKPVAVSMENLQFMQDANGSLFLYTQFTEEQLESAPEYNQENYATNRDQMLLQQGVVLSDPAATEAPVETQSVPVEPAPAAPAN